MRRENDAAPGIEGYFSGESMKPPEGSFGEANGEAVRVTRRRTQRYEQQHRNGRAEDCSVSSQGVV